MRLSAFKLGAEGVLLSCPVPLDLKDVWLAAHLAIFDVALPVSRRLIHHRLIPLSTACALEACSNRHRYPAPLANPLLVYRTGRISALQGPAHVNQDGVERRSAAKVGQALGG